MKMIFVRKIILLFKLYVRRIKKIALLYSILLQNVITRKNSKKLVLIYSEKIQNPGLTDRLIGAICSYIIAKENGYEFCLYHDAGFCMQKYLVPNLYDWSITKSEVNFSLLALLFGKIKLLFSPNKLITLDSRVSEYHCYDMMWNIIPELPEKMQKRYSMEKVFHLLFRPTDYLRNILDAAINAAGLTSADYMSVHIRFLNYFEQVEAVGMCTTDENQQQAMLASIHRTLEEIHLNNNLPILLFSDSQTFLQMPHPEWCKILQGSVGHIGVRGNVDEIVDKTFVDLYLMAHGNKIVSIVGQDLYTSGFPCFAAKIGGCDFERMNRIF